MQSPAEYITRTESAVRLLLGGIDSYLQVLRNSPDPIFRTSAPLARGPASDREFEAWFRDNTSSIAAAKAARMQFMAESFALGTLCGAILQIAAKALECFSENKIVPGHLQAVVGSGRAKYCVGRLVRSVPLGLVVYAARNQHAHFNEEALREPNVEIFERLATLHEYSGSLSFRDPAFDLQSTRIDSFAANVTALIGWRDYETYIGDINAMLGT